MSEKRPSEEFPEPSAIHKAQPELEGKQEISNPMVTERLTNFYFGHFVVGEHTLKHGVLYSVYGQPFAGLGDAIKYCRANETTAPPVALQEEIIAYVAKDNEHLKIKWKPAVIPTAPAAAAVVAESSEAAEESAEEQPA